MTVTTLTICMTISACGQAPVITELAGAESGILNGSPNVSDASLERLLAVYADVQRAPQLDASHFRLVIDDDSRSEHCHGASDACTEGVGGSITVYAPWADTYGCYIAAEMIAHELGHVLAGQAYGDPDAGHTHHELFARPGGEYAAFPGEIGASSDTADMFCK
jgi:hypothetical protein